VGHHELSIADIEFVGTDPQGALADAFFLDDADVVLIEDRRPAARARAAATPRRRTAPLPARYSRIFDDAETRVWSRI
jgi:hypothetical protein